MMVQPRLGGGLRDYLPADMVPRQRMIEEIRKAFELFGFLPLDTPGLETEEILTGGDPNFQKQIFRAGLREGNEKLALRFDLTVPLARVVAQHYDQLEKPFKRYQVGKVWRGEKPQARRFREFVQFDADIVGTSMLSADAEIIALMYQTMTQLGFDQFSIRVNNRKVLNGLPEYVGFDANNITEVLRLIDKVDRMGWENVSGELRDGFNFSDAQLDALKRFLDFRAGSQTETIKGIQSLMNESATAMEGIRELEEITRHVRALGVPDDRWVIDLSVARGLGYYTGPVFETVLTNLPSIGSVFSGGRFDGLVSRFSSLNVPCTGASVGVDRLFAAMTKLGLVVQESRIAQVAVLNFDADCEIKCEEIATQLRQAGIPTELYLGKETTLKGQLAYVVRNEFPVTILIGPDEKDKSVVQVKNMRARTQEEVSETETVSRVQEALSDL